MAKAIDLILSEPWLIQAEALERIILIAERNLDAPELLAARQGKPLDNTRSVEIHGNTAVIPVRGPIFRYANLFTEISGATSLEVLARDFATAQDDRAIERLVLAIDSPGGQATGIAEFAAMIRASDKPVIAYAGDLAASAGYWVAAAAHRLIASPTALLGSIGVVGSYRAEKNEPIKVISTQSPLKQADPRTETGRAEMQRVIDDLAAVFVANVATYRGTDQDSVLADFGRGGLLVGAKAVAAGMADAVGSLESIIAGDSGPTSQEAFTMSTQTDKQKGPEVTVEWLRANHADVYTEIRGRAAEEAIETSSASLRAEGAEAERTRIQAVREQLIPGHEALIERLAFDGQTTGEQAAIQVLAAERALRAEHQRSQREDTPPPVPSAERPQQQAAATFETKVEEGIAAGLSRGQAMKAAANSHPDMHKAWLARINPAATSAA